MMATRAISTLDLSDAENAKTWLIAFSALARAKKWKDGVLANGESLEITDNFIATCGLVALNKAQYIVAPENIVEMKFDDIETRLLAYLKPKQRLVIAERTKFFTISQFVSESVADYVTRLRKESQYCDFAKLKESTDPNEELVLMALVAGLRDPLVKEKVLEKIQSSPTELTILAIQEFVQQYEELKKFVSDNQLASPTTNNDDDRELNFNVVHRKKILKCTYCGLSHLRGKCPAYGKKCNKCLKNNHFASVCKSARTVGEHCIENNDISFLGHAPCVNVEVNSVENNLITVSIEGRSMRMQVDSGAAVSVISSKMWKDLGKPTLKSCNARLVAYDDHVMPCLGKFTAGIENDEQYFAADLVVIQANKSFGLWGRDLITSESRGIDQVDAKLKHSPNYLPPIKGVLAKMELIKGMPNVFCRARPVPIALEDEVAAELDRLEEAAVIAKCKDAGVDNASPVVWVRKPSGKLRMCVDFKMHVNSRIKSDAYPTPNTETIFARLKNAKTFAKIDLTSAYHQIALDKEAQDLSIINTTKGLYRVQRLQMGMKNASAIFQRTMEQILVDIKGVLIYQDDVLIYAANKESLTKRMNAVRKRLSEKCVTINEAKSVKYLDEVVFLGFKLSSRGIEPDTQLVQKIVDMKAPTNKKEVEAFVGLVNYFGRLIPNFSGKLVPINNLRKHNVVFHWSDECERAFQNLKTDISRSPVLQPYSLSKEVVLTTDASKGAMAGVLTQDGHPVIYVSRSFSKAESNYSNIEREAMAIMWSVTRLKQFLLGRTFIIHTDHKPLVQLFGSTNGIPSGTSARICRWALNLMPYNYIIKYVKGTDISHADGISRLGFRKCAPDDQDECCAELINDVHFASDLLDPHCVRNELACDRFMQQIFSRVRSGSWSRCSQAERPFQMCRDRLTIHDDMLYFGSRLFIPARLRWKAFCIAHSDGHSGVQSTINRLQISAWWPGMAADVAVMVEKCPTCCDTRTRLGKSVNTWPSAKPFERIHMDWAYIKEVGELLIIVDAGSGWIEAFVCKNRTSDAVILCLRTVFTRFGVPEVVVSDNAPEFVSAQLNQWLINQGTRKMESPIYFPRANGAAERAVQTVKRALRCWKFEKAHQTFHAFLQKVLFHHRCSSFSRGKSPSEIVFGRALRVPIVSSFQQGEPVNFKKFSAQETAEPATFLMTKGQNTSWILRDGVLTLASNNQIGKCPERPRTDGLKDVDILLNPNHSRLYPFLKLQLHSIRLVCHMMTRFSLNQPTCYLTKSFSLALLHDQQ